MKKKRKNHPTPQETQNIQEVVWFSLRKTFTDGVEKLLIHPFLFKPTLGLRNSLLGEKTELLLIAHLLISTQVYLGRR